MHDEILWEIDNLGYWPPGWRGWACAAIAVFVVGAIAYTLWLDFR